jgi:hypothetical protein
MIIKLPGGQLRNQEALAIHFTGPILSRLWPTEDHPCMVRNSDAVMYCFKYDYHPSSLLVSAIGKSILSLLVAPYGTTMGDKPILKEVSSWAANKDRDILVSASLTDDYKEIERGVFCSSIPLDKNRPFVFHVEPVSMGAQLSLMMNGYIRKIVGE